jgi:hypothetical protein
LLAAAVGIVLLTGLVDAPGVQAQTPIAPQVNAASETRPNVSGLCNYPTLSPTITTFPQSWYLPNSATWDFENGPRTCRFNSKRSVSYECWSETGSTTIDFIAGAAGEDGDRNSFAADCDGRKHDISAATGWRGATHTPYHIHWHLDGGSFRGSTLTVN